ncbi:hypothetical protein BH39T_PBIAJDOK_02382 [Barrientosiimonas humi]|nr:hypothetical protein BH39T_PBIAJDOK_02382 [Barrientosiimonas humi]
MRSVTSIWVAATSATKRGVTAVSSGAQPRRSLISASRFAASAVRIAPRDLVVPARMPCIVTTMLAILGLSG